MTEGSPRVLAKGVMGYSPSFSFKGHNHPRLNKTLGICIYIYIHVHICIYVHTRTKNTYIHTLHTYIHTYIHKYINT